MRPVFLAFAVLTIPAPAAPPEVAVVRPVVREITDSAEFTGRVEPSASVELRSREIGLLEKVLFKEGADVKKGDLLFQIDDRLPRAELAKVEAEVAKAEAELRLTEVELKRLTALAGAKAVGPEELDRARAAVEKGKADIAVAKAALGLARVKVEYTRIVAPMAGRIGRVSVDPGNVVGPDIVLATLTATDPVYVAFDLDERTFLRLRRWLLEKRAVQPVVPVEIGFRDEEGFSAKGSVDVGGAAVDPKKGTVAVRTSLANAGNRVVVGQFARLRVPLGEPRKALLVPEHAVADATIPEGLLPKRGDAKIVFVVTDKNVTKYRVVGVSKMVDQMYVVEDGLSADDWLVADGRKRRDGEEVTPRKGDAPTEKQAPTPLKAESFAPRPPPDFPTSGPTLIVTASYPGASSAVVEETVAAPINKQLEGLDGLVSRVHVCTDDGRLRMTLTFKAGTDLNEAGIQAHKRVALAEPTLPEPVRREGVVLSKRTTHLMAVAITSPNGRHDRQFLSAYAANRLREDVARVSGIGDAALFGADGPEPSVRLWLDRDKLSAVNLRVGDVTDALRRQNLSVFAVGKPDAGPTLTLGGRTGSPEDLGKIILRSDRAGQITYLADVARIERVAGWPALTAVDGRPAAILMISRTPDANAKDTEKAIRQWLAEMRKQFPVGLEAKVIGD
jgi:RND family efflux transporter MFP subunit